ncbi:uncharacterized protein LOC142994621 isoform X3 [Genypterus blacodes]|uniref:uncharacterized protein LOC142994621 isoform X3 n=1 Tax=Genypterus blacodes TaxID=154954 RepID=UPI003F761011
MSVSKPSESFSVTGKSSSTMRLPLHSAGDQNGNAFPISLSSSSSSSSSCLGGSSPDSLRNLSSLSGCCTNSPLDCDMFEVTMITRVMTTTDKMTEVVISKWTTDEEGEKDNNDDVFVGNLQNMTESRSNDNSVSVYLDANSDEYSQGTWNDNLTLAFSMATSGYGDNDDLSSRSSIEIRHSSSTPDSDATEVPADDDDDDEEEASFLSVSSDMGAQGASVTCSNGETGEGFLTLQPVDIECSPVVVSTAVGPLMDSFVDLYGTQNPGEDFLKTTLDLQQPESQELNGQLTDTVTGCLAFEDVGEVAFISSATSPCTNQIVNAEELQLNSPSEETKRCVSGSKPAPPKTSQLRAAKTKPNLSNFAAAKMMASTAAKASNVEPKRVPKQDLKNIKAKVASRPSPSTLKTARQQNKASPANGKRAAAAKKEVQTGDGAKRQRVPTTQTKGGSVLKPIRGNNTNHSNHSINQRAEANDFTQAEQKRKKVLVNGAQSTTISCLDSEVPEQRPLDTPREGEDVQEGLDEENPSEHASGEAVKDFGETLMTETAVERPRNHSTKVSSKLGPNARQQGKCVTRGDKGPPGPSLPPGSGTGPPGPRSPGPRQPQTEGSSLEEGGSPMRVRENQSQGIPKPRTTAERAHGLAAPGSATTSNSKPTANQQPSSGLAVRSAAPNTSKLPIKGLPTSPSSTSLGGSSELNGSSNRASPASSGGPAPTVNKPEDQPNRSTIPVGSQSRANPPSCTTTAANITNTACDAVSSANNAVTVKAPAMRSRALSLQGRITTPGLKAQTSTNLNAAKTAANQTAAKTYLAVNQRLTKQPSQYPLQRSSSVRLYRLNTAASVDKNKPREAPARPANSSLVPPSTGGNNQQQQQQQQQQQPPPPPPPDPVPDLVNANAPVAPVLPTPVPNSNNTGTTATSGLRARTWSRCSTKAGSRIQKSAGTGAGGGGSATVADGTVPAKQNKEQAEKKNQAINQLRRLLTQGNKRVEALATVIQHLFTEREETLKQKKELSQKLVTLRDELVTSSHCCERLQKEKEEVRLNLEEALNKLEEQHKEELGQLEERLRSFYQTEWDKVHQTYQEEADKCRVLMEQQVEELRSRQEAERKNQEVSHSQKVESLRQQHEASVQEMKQNQQTDLENLEKSSKETETSLSEKISVLSAEKEALTEKLEAEEERRRRILSDKNLDSHTVYLEQELESLKVVLEMKNNQLHQKEKKLMEMDKLVETNVKLEEYLNKVQQENEDYRARMDKHAALSKQLTSEQAVLQQTLQKESKVNKRLSMENEELLWKLHNGDLLASPRRLSPTSPFASPRNSASFPTTAPLSPR